MWTWRKKLVWLISRLWHWDVRLSDYLTAPPIMLDTRPLVRQTEIRPGLQNRRQEARTAYRGQSLSLTAWFQGLLISCIALIEHNFIHINLRKDIVEWIHLVQIPPIPLRPDIGLATAGARSSLPLPLLLRDARTQPRADRQFSTPFVVHHSKSCAQDPCFDRENNANRPGRTRILGSTWSRGPTLQAF